MIYLVISDDLVSGARHVVVDHAAYIVSTSLAGHEAVHFRTALVDMSIEMVCPAFLLIPLSYRKVTHNYQLTSVAHIVHLLYIVEIGL